MAFKCEMCKKVQPNNSKGHRVTTQIREVTYPKVRTRDGKIKTPVGFETVKELLCCEGCYSSNKNFPAAVVGSKVLKGEEKEITYETI